MQGDAKHLAWIIAACVLIAPRSSLALSCEYFPKAVEESRNAVILRPGEMLQELAKTDIGVPAGMPTQYDLVRFEVIEVLKGEPPVQLDMYCPHTRWGACTPDRMAPFVYIGGGGKFRDYAYPALYDCVYGPADETVDPRLRDVLETLRNGRRQRQPGTRTAHD